MAASRKLAAIMFTDIVGYTALMGRDETKAVELLRVNRNLHKRLINQYEGKLLKEMGDGILASFPTITDAVYCAGSIQKETAQNDGLNLQIGIHQGEILFEGDDIYGDGVNIASRIEGLAESGQILVSEGVYNNVKNRTGITGKFEGEHEFKNVDRTVKVYSIQVEEFPEVAPVVKSGVNRRVLFGALIGTVLILLLFLNPFSGLNTDHQNEAFEDEEVISIAVLPFDNFSQEKEENQYLCDGFMEEILNHLSKIGSIQVRSRSSVEQYRENRPTIPEIAQKLGTTHILEGSLQKIGDGLRIHAQLINAREDRHIWQESYQEQMSDIFQLQSRIAEQIAGQLQIRLTSEEVKSIETSPTENLEAYDYFLRAKNHGFNWAIGRKRSDFENADLHYKKAGKEDSSFALAMVQRASLYWGAINGRHFDLFPQENMDSILILCNRAIGINPNLADAYRIRSLYFLLKRDSERRRLDIERAFELNPNDPETIQVLGAIHFRDQNYIRGFQLLHKAERLSAGEQGVVWLYDVLAYCYLEIMDTEEAGRYWGKTFTIVPDFFVGIEIKYRCLSTKRC